MTGNVLYADVRTASRLRECLVERPLRKGDQHTLSRRWRKGRGDDWDGHSCPPL